MRDGWVDIQTQDIAFLESRPEVNGYETVGEFTEVYLTSLAPIPTMLFGMPTKIFLKDSHCLTYRNSETQDWYSQYKLIAVSKLSLWDQLKIWKINFLSWLYV